MVPPDAQDTAQLIIAEADRIAALKSAGPMLGALLSLLAGLPLLAARTGQQAPVLELLQRARQAAEFTRDVDGFAAVAEAAGDGYAVFRRMHELGDQLLALDGVAAHDAFSGLLGGLVQAAVHRGETNAPESQAILLRVVEHALWCGTGRPAARLEQREGER